MRKIISLTVLVLCVFFTSAQITPNKVDLNASFAKFLPSNIDPKDVSPSDIPSVDILKQMGLKDAEITQIMDYKNSRGAYAKINNGNSDSEITIKELDQVLNNEHDNLDTTIFPVQRIFGQDIFRYSNINFFNKALDAKAPENYKVGCGDGISIAVWGYSQFSETLVVDDRGYINPSTYGRIYVKGLTFKRMRSLIKTKFSSFLDMKNSEIDVTLSYSRVITVNIVGEVFYPGSYSIPAINTAFNALMAAKGPNQLGSVRNIYLKRNGKTVDSLDVYQFLFDPIRSQDIYMQDGDYLFVPPAGKIVDVAGEVNRPFTYEAKQGESVSDLIKYAGGYTPNAFTDVLTLKRIEYNSIRVNDVYKDHAKSTFIQNGDNIMVNTISNRLSNVVTIKGSIGVQGDYEFIKGEKLLTFLKRAKCIDERTFLDKVYVIRLNKDRTKTHIAVNLAKVINDPNHEDNVWMQEYDIVRVLSIDDFDEYYTVSIYGAVRQPGDFDFGDGMTLQDLLVQSGGLKFSAEENRIEISRVVEYDRFTKNIKPRRAIVKTIKAGKDLIVNTEAKDFVLNPLDQVFVRYDSDFKPRKKVRIHGEVSYEGSYTIVKDNETVSSLISRAGGLTKFAYNEGAILFRKYVYEHRNQDDKMILPDVLLDSIIKTPGIRDVYNTEMIRLLAKQENGIDSIFYEPVYFDLNKALSQKKSKHNIVLQEGDSLYIPLKLDVVTVEGALHFLDGNSISAPFLGKRANYYVKNFAGGYASDNKRSNTVVLYANGVTRKTRNYGLFTVSPRIKPGSVIKVMDDKQIERVRKPIDWNEAIENTMLKITAIMTLWLLIDRVTAD